MILEHEDDEYVSILCKLSGVSRSGFYEWKNRKESNRSIENKKLLFSIKTFYHESDETYGAIRIQDDLKDAGMTCSLNRVARLMSLEGIQSVHRKKYTPQTTDSKHNLRISDNVIAQDFSAKGPNEKWGCDISYIRTAEGFLYLAIVMDFYSRKIIGFCMNDSMDDDLCIKALTMALILRGPPKKLILHSDRGSQYASDDYRKLISKYQLTQSMSRTGNCYDNAMVESFFHTLKVERVYRQIYTTKKYAKEDITRYIHAFYNCKRKHSALDYMAPNHYEQMAA